MKRTIFLKLFILICAMLYSLTITLSISNDYIFHKLWFSTALFFLANLILLRSVFYRIDSSLFLAILLYACFAIGYCSYNFNFNVFQALAGYVFSAGYASLVVFIFFRQIFHLKTFAFLMLAVVILIVYSVNKINLITFCVFSSVYIILLTIYVIKSIKTNTRKV